MSITPYREKGPSNLSIQSDIISIYITNMSVILREKNCDVLLLPCFYLYYIEFLSDTFPFVAALCYREDLVPSPCLCLHSAGVGRTGTFIVIDSMIDMMHMEQRVDVFGSVSRIREQRCQLIQTDVSVDPLRPVVPWTDSSTRCSSRGINKRGHGKQPRL